MNTSTSLRLAGSIETVIENIRQRLPKSDSELVAQLAQHFFASAIPEDLAKETPDNLFGMATAIWKHVRKRDPGQPNIRVYNPNIEEHGWHCSHTVVEIVTDNSPFLIDSTLAALNLLDLATHLVIHPVIQTCRNDKGEAEALLARDDASLKGIQESVIHVQVNRQTGEKAFANIVERLQEVHADIRVAVEDWKRMLARVDELIEELRTNDAAAAAESEISEQLAFLEWLRNNNFTFLGARDYVIEERDGATYLRAAEAHGLGLLRKIRKISHERYQRPLPKRYASYLYKAGLVTITKTRTRSNVHRPVYMDHIRVRRFDTHGNISGERRFIGLFTSTAYNTPPSQIPILRGKVEAVMASSGFGRSGHGAKMLRHILENLPRDDLFQIDLDTLARTARGILQLEHRQRLRLFLRRDVYGVFFSALVFVPRDAYSTNLRERLEQILLRHLNGVSIETATQFSEAPMVRAYFIVRVEEDTDIYPDVIEIERELTQAARNWDDDFRDAMIEGHGEAEGTRRYRKFTKTLPEQYKTDFSPRAAVADIRRILLLKTPGSVQLNLYRRVTAEDSELDFKIYRSGLPIPLSSIIPMLEHMGMIVVNARYYSIKKADSETGVTVYDFRLTNPSLREVDVGELRERFESLFADVWHDRVENDPFNHLVLHGLNGRDISLLRAYAKYLRQAKSPFSIAYMAETLNAHPHIARLLLDQIHALHGPEAGSDSNQIAAQIGKKIRNALDDIVSADQDRILQRFMSLADATLRTNFYQQDAEGKPKPAIVLKFDCAAISDLPSPRPWREAFVYSPRFEAVHLRGGPVARGGIRWSDRREDYRTEILGLMKAQSVKNAVIVPVGAKGGFALTRPPARDEELRAEAVRCYRTFISALLDVTDNLVDGKIQPRMGLVRESDDPYLVVAADKGTATFSDEANQVAAEYGFWLDDAFASGGSSGYDHKVMGITARGAWEAVKRHFRELDRDIRSEDFTVIGIGDMSGDVFGNGMLLSKHIRLVGAFNHLHIFLDPNPEAAKSHAERARLFALPRSSWEDYDKSLISEGGGVFSRQSKSIPLSPQIRKLLGVRARNLPPNELIQALLIAEVDLLWNGGVGTYVKARDESHIDVADRANDGVRVNATSLRCKVIGEGGNLGLTQAARVEFAKAGGKVNSDAIDNSAGVDCSDHEVNIKILLNAAIASGDLTVQQRDRRLVEMTDEIASMVLSHNYLQTQCLSMVESLGMSMFEEQVRFLRFIESSGRLAEHMPDEEEIASRRRAGKPLTRPELSVLLAYAKIQLFNALVVSDLLDDPYLQQDLEQYFPVPLRTDFVDRMRSHRLQREIIATRIASQTIERAGITFIHRHTEHSGIASSAVVQAFLQARDIFRLDKLWAAIEKTDYVIKASLQAELHARIMFFIDRMTTWFLSHVSPSISIGEVIGKYRKEVDALEKISDEVLDVGARHGRDEEIGRLVSLGVPDELARSIARLDSLSATCDIVDIAHQTDTDPTAVSRVFFEIGHRYACCWLRDHASELVQRDHWDRLAVQAITEDSYTHQRMITLHVLAANEGTPSIENIDVWQKKNRAAVRQFQTIFQELENVSPSLATLNITNRALRMLSEHV